MRGGTQAALRAHHPAPSPLEQHTAPLTHPPFPFRRQLFTHVIRSWATTQIEIFYYGPKIYRMVGSHCSCPVAIQTSSNGEWVPQKEGGRRRKATGYSIREGRCLGLSLLQSCQWQCQQYFSPNTQTLLAQIYLFTWFMVHAHTNLSMHRQNIFQHSCTFVRQRGISGKKRVTYSLQWLFHTCNWRKNLFFLLIMTDVSKKCTWVLVQTLSLQTMKRNLIAFVHSLFQCCICFSFNYIGCVRMSIIIPTSF